MKYPSKVIEHFFSPHNVGEWSSSKHNILTVKAGSFSLGSLVQIQIRCDKRRIDEAKFKTFGNPYLIAASSLACKWLEGRDWEQLNEFSYQLLIDELEIPKSEHYCAILVEDAIKLLLKQRNENE